MADINNEQIIYNSIQKSFIRTAITSFLIFGSGIYLLYIINSNNINIGDYMLYFWMCIIVSISLLLFIKYIVNYSKKGVNNINLLVLIIVSSISIGFSIALIVNLFNVDYLITTPAWIGLIMIIINILSYIKELNIKDSISVAILSIFISAILMFTIDPSGGYILGLLLGSIFTSLAVPIDIHYMINKEISSFERKQKEMMFGIDSIIYTICILKKVIG